MSNGMRSEYPTMAPATWWHLRKRFRKAVPAMVTKEYLISALISTDESVPKSTLGDLRRASLIDEDGVPTDLARKWVEDGRYAEVCGVIRERVYPLELREFGSDRSRIAAWFARSAGVPENQAKRMAAFYLMIVEADLAMIKSLSSPST